MPNVCEDPTPRSRSLRLLVLVVVPRRMRSRIASPPSPSLSPSPQAFGRVVTMSGHPPAHGGRRCPRNAMRRRRRRRRRPSSGAHRPPSAVGPVARKIAPRARASARAAAILPTTACAWKPSGQDAPTTSSRLAPAQRAAARCEPRRGARAPRRTRPGTRCLAAERPRRGSQRTVSRAAPAAGGCTCGPNSGNRCASRRPPSSGAWRSSGANERRRHAGTRGAAFSPLDVARLCELCGSEPSPMRTQTRA